MKGEFYFWTMDKAGLLEELNQTLPKKKVEKLAALGANQHYEVADLLELSFYPRSEIAFRAAWVLEYILEKYPERFLPLLNDFLKLYPEQKNPSCQRHYSKMLAHLLKTGRLNQADDRIDFDLLVESTFGWLIDEQTPVAVKVHCLEVLFVLKDKSPWILEELKSQIEFLMRHGSAGIQSRGRAILKKIASK